ncbi:MAG: SH3 domain-containing protein [Thermoanaerobaculia bacterium]
MMFTRAVLTALALLLLAGCAGEEPLAPPRDTLAIRYVADDEVVLRAEPDASSRQVATYLFGETASVLSERDGWAEVRIDFERSGWVPASSLQAESPSAGAVETTGADGSPIPRFRIMPNPIFSGSGARGEIVLEASVNTAGEIFEVRTLRNTTGNPALEAQNREELRRARFFPLKVGGVAKPFVYEHRVEY